MTGCGVKEWPDPVQHLFEDSEFKEVKLPALVPELVPLTQKDVD